MSRNVLPQFFAGVFLGLVVLAIARLWAAPLERFVPAADVSAEPFVAVEPSAWDFGRAAPGQSLEACFRVSNHGGRRLILRRSDGSCDCLATHEAEILIEPGASRSIVAKLDNQGSAGVVCADLLLRTNDPRQPLLRLSCRAQVE